MTLFIIQKVCNHFRFFMHINLNEIVVLHKPANDDVFNTETKTEYEIKKIQKEYINQANDDK